MAFDDARGQVVLMGGQDLGQTFADTWAWDGSVWMELKVGGPGPRSFHAMTGDAERDRILLYGGRQGDQLFADLWSWDGREWELLANAGPLRRGIYASAYDPAGGGLVIHGGGDLIEGNWILEPTTWTWTDGAGWVQAAALLRHQRRRLRLE
jgi:hypothetical protein